MAGIGSWRSWFRKEEPVTAASEPVEAPAPVVVEVGRYCTVTRVKGQAEHHSLCAGYAERKPMGDFVITTGHWVV